jgi:hypothetical protein
MTDEMIALGRRAVACKVWRWMPGMRWIVSRVAPLEDYAGRIVDGGRRAPDGPGLPDLSDPATLGCLLALVREAWEDPHLYTLHDIHWTVRLRDGVTTAFEPEDDSWVGTGATEAQALVAALEAAPTG